MSDYAFSILKLIIKPEFLEYYKDWWDDASEKEVRGLQLIDSIYKHKGRKRFRASPPTVQLKNLSDDHILTVKKAEEIFRKNQTQSTYGTEYGYLQSSLKPQYNVLKYKKISEVHLNKSSLT